MHAILWDLDCILNTTGNHRGLLPYELKWCELMVGMRTPECAEAWQIIQPGGKSALTFALGFDGAIERDLETQKEGKVLRHSKGHPYGEENLPQNRMQLALLCLMKKRKGWSAQNLGPYSMQHSTTTMPEAAAASVPSSFTSTKLLCTNLDRHRSLSVDIAKKSALRC